MLYLDKSKNENEIIVTVTEGNTFDSTAYSMAIHSHFTNKTYSIPLGTNTSLYPERFDSFVISKSAFEDFEDGVYVYKVINTADTSSSLEIGYLKIVGGQQQEEYVNPDINETDDDYIVYEY